VLASQRYAEHGEEDVVRRAETDSLLLRHPLLSVAHWETFSGPWGRTLCTVLRRGGGSAGGGAPTAAGTTTTTTTLGASSSAAAGATSSIAYLLPCPGNPVADGIGEGKPHNQLNGVTFARGRCLQTIDMNQQGYFEQALLLPNALSLLLPRLPVGGVPAVGSAAATATATATATGAGARAGSGGSDAVSATRAYGSASGRPLVCLGLREHIYTHSLSAPAFFMAQQEYLFGTLWQRLMASPLRTRLHYGHPDIFDAVWVAVRGGTAKASSVVNVSEDVFAGLTVALRGGESGHISFLSVGKGRDVGMLQIEVFESKISGGTAISGTTRDAWRALAGMDLARSFSAYHTGLGFYISNVLAIASAMVGLYYMAFMACSGASAAVQRSGSVYLLGSVTLLQWVMQLGLLSVVPLAVLYALEHGVVRAVGKTLVLFSSLSPLFYMYEIQTKAYFFDAALAFGQQAYLATGRDFVIRHTSFVEVWCAAAHSHFYLGAEAAVLLCAVTALGTYDSSTAYTFFFLSAWLLTASLLLAPLLFNPGAMELRALRGDWGEWFEWLSGNGGSGRSGAGVSAHAPPPTTPPTWAAWHGRVGEGPYAQASCATRVWRGVRLARLPFAAALLLSQLELKRGGEVTVLVLQAVAPWGGLVALQAWWSLGEGGAWCARRQGWGGGCSRSGAVARCLAWAHWGVVGVCTLGGGLGVLYYCWEGGYYNSSSSGSSSSALLLGGAAWGVVAVFFLAAWAVRSVVVVGLWPLFPAARLAWCFLDGVLGSLLLALQTLLAALVPMATTLHARVMYSREYADAVAVVSGSRAALEAHGSAGGVRSLGLEGIDPLAFGAGGAHHHHHHHGHSSKQHPRRGGQGEGGGEGGEGEEEEQPRYHLGDRKWRLKKLQGFAPMATADAAAGVRAVPVPLAVGAGSSSSPGMGAGGGAALGGVFSVGFGGLAAQGGSAPPLPPAAAVAVAVALGASSPAPTPAAPAGLGQQMPTVGQILASAQKRAAAAAAAAAAPSQPASASASAAAAAAGAGSKSGGAPGGGGGGRGGGRGTASASSPLPGDAAKGSRPPRAEGEGGGASGFAAMRARFEKKWCALFFYLCTIIGSLLHFR
jgi:hypothetical protein